MGRSPRIGIFGGTFDPPHIGHMAAATQVAREAKLDRILWVPTALPPHKTARSTTPGRIRLRMVRAAIRGHPRFCASEIEVARGGVSYTVDTLRQLRSEHPHWRLALIIGADLFRSLELWREPDAIRELAEIIVTSRPGADPPPPAQLDQGARAVAVTPVELSASRVRERVKNGLTVSNMVAPAVLAIIQDEGLYGNSDPG